MILKQERISCDTCVEYRRENCGGCGICSDYQHAYTIPEDERKLMIGYRERSTIHGIKYKSQKNRLHGEFFYPRDETYYAYSYIDNGRRY